jgi:hypothetical protein
MKLQAMLLNLAFLLHERGGMTKSKAVVAAVLWVGLWDEDEL